LLLMNTNASNRIPYVPCQCAYYTYRRIANEMICWCAQHCQWTKNNSPLPVGSFKLGPSPYYVPKANFDLSVVIFKLPFELQQKLGSRFGTWNGTRWISYQPTQHDMAIISYSIRYDQFLPCDNTPLKVERQRRVPMTPTLSMYMPQRHPPEHLDDDDISSLDSQSMEYECKICNVLLPSKTTWVAHKVSRKHLTKKNGIKQHICSTCKAVCGTDVELLRHKASHNEDYIDDMVKTFCPDSMATLESRFANRYSTTDPEYQKMSSSSAPPVLDCISTEARRQFLERVQRNKSAFQPLSNFNDKVIVQNTKHLVSGVKSPTYTPMSPVTLKPLMHTDQGFQVSACDVGPTPCAITSKVQTTNGQVPVVITHHHLIRDILVTLRKTRKLLNEVEIWLLAPVNTLTGSHAILTTLLCYVRLMISRLPQVPHVHRLMSTLVIPLLDSLINISVGQMIAGSIARLNALNRYISHLIFLLDLIIMTLAFVVDLQTMSASKSQIMLLYITLLKRWISQPLGALRLILFATPKSYDVWIQNFMTIFVYRTCTPS
jgi:transcription elongation factor Elf1